MIPNLKHERHEDTTGNTGLLGGGLKSVSHSRSVYDQAQLRRNG